MKRTIALLILAPFIVWMTICWGFFFIVFVIPVILGATLEWLYQAAKGRNQTFRESWMLGWKDSCAQGTLDQIRHPLK